MNHTTTAATAALAIQAILTITAQAQVTLVRDDRRITVTTVAGNNNHNDAQTPSPAFSPFDAHLDAVSSSCCAIVGATANQHSQVSPTLMAGRGDAFAGGQAGPGGLANAASASTFFLTFDLAAPLQARFHGTLTGGLVFTPQAFFRNDSGTVAFQFTAAANPTFDVTLTIPPGRYFLAAQANVTVGLTPDTEISDQTAYDVALELSPACPADFNGDGFLDFFDFSAFVDCFEGVECPPGKDADFNHDGFPDFFDFDAYTEAFEAGC